MTLAQNGTWSPITFEQVRAGLVLLWKGAYGENADTDANTPDGLEITMIAMLISQAFDVDTALWNNSFFRSAVGQSLDRILDLLGKKRELATASTATAVFYGAPATAIPVLTTVITADTAANRFQTDVLEAVGADDNSDAWVTRILAVDVGTIYTAQVNAELPAGYTALLGDTVDIVAEGLRDAINVLGDATAALAGTDVAGNPLIVSEIVGGSGNWTVVSVPPLAVLDAFEAVRAPVTATEAGPVLAAAGTLQTITNPIVGIVGVSNDADATPGVDEESDDEFRARHLQTLFAAAARTDSGMRAAVLAIPSEPGGVPGSGIVEVSVTSNRTTSPVDAFGRPLHSVEVVFLVEEGLDLDTEVANAIARQIPAGIEPYGLADLGPGTTIDGEVINVLATRTEELYLWIDVVLTAGESFPTAGDTEVAVAVAIANYFDLGEISTVDGVIFDPNAKLITGKDMLRTAAASPINQATNNGTTNFVMTTDATTTPGGPPTLVAADQPATIRQIIRADASRITVTVAP